MSKHKLSEKDSELDDEDSDDNIFIKNPRELFRSLLYNCVNNKGYARFGIILKYDEIIDFLNTKEHWRSISLEYIRALLNRINEECFY